MTYADLIAAIEGWLRRPDAEQQIPTFVALAEAQINRRLAVAGIAGAAVRADASVAGEFIDAPADLATPLRLTLDDGGVVDCVTLEGLDTLRHLHGAGPGRPTAFTVVGGQMRFQPVPDKVYGAELVYQRTLEPLSPTTAANWLIEAHPDVYLYGALVQAAPYLGDDQRLSLWSGLYASALDDMVAAERAKRGSQMTPGYRPQIPMPHKTFNIFRGF